METDISAELDSILPTQFFRARRHEAPELRLMIAILHDALDCVMMRRGDSRTSARRLFYEAKRWFLEESSAWPYSFRSICDALDLDYEALRERLDLDFDPPPRWLPAKRAGWSSPAGREAGVVGQG